MEAVLKWITALAQQLGANDPAVVVVVAIVAFLFLALIIFALRTTIQRNQETDRTSAILARVELLEQSMKGFRADMERTVSDFKEMTADVRQEMSRVRRSTGGGGSEGGSGAGGGNGGSEGSGGGFGGLGRKSKGSDEEAGTTDAAPTRADSARGASGPDRSGTIASGLTKTRRSFLGRLKGIFSSKPVFDDTSLDELEETLIAADVGPRCAVSIVGAVRDAVNAGTVVDEGRVRELVKGEIRRALVSVPGDHRMYAPHGSPMVVLVVGVNGVGKTTTVAKLAARWKGEGKRVVVVAADTFRAAAVEQLKEWGTRLDVKVVYGSENAKPGTVVYDGMVAALADSADVVIIDTAGRLHTKSNLMQELEGIRNSIAKHVPDGPHETILVLDGVSGQNALSQAREFHECVRLTGVIVTKLDGTPKGGIVVAISRELALPVLYVGVGERASDLVPFSVDSFVSGLVEDDSEGDAASSPAIASSGAPTSMSRVAFGSSVDNGSLRRPESFLH